MNTIDVSIQAEFAAMVREADAEHNAAADADFEATRQIIKDRGLTWETDPGHGWLIVSKDEIRWAGLSEKDFSRCSYQNCNLVALEEDCDAAIFIYTLFNKREAGDLKSREAYRDPTHIRGWRPYGKNEATMDTVRAVMSKAGA